MSNLVRNRLKELREARGVGAAELARTVGVTRQTIHAIEGGAYLPNTETALRLSRELEVSFEELFSLGDTTDAVCRPVQTTVLSASPATGGQPARLCRVGSKWVSVPVNAVPYYMPEADGLMQFGRSASQAAITPFAAGGSKKKRLVAAGCDPAMGLLGHMVEQTADVEIVCAAASSRLALRWLAEGTVHIAGMHLEDERTGEFNMPFIRRQFPKSQMCVVTFARWEEGLAVARGNPKNLREVSGLARRGVKLVNREQGSGSRALLDRLLTQAGIAASRVHGYDRVVYGHLAAAWCVSAGTADVCLATRAAAQAFALDFIPLHAARYDLAMTKETADAPAAQAFLNVLQRAALRRKLEVLAGYDTSSTGAIVNAPQ